METYFTYIIEASVCIAVFYLFYILLLHKETGFKFTRLYLVSAILISMLLPLNKFSIDIFESSSIQQIQNLEKQNLNQSNSVNSNPREEEPNISKASNSISTAIDYLLWTRIIYYIVFAGVLLRLFIGLAMIYSYYWKSGKERLKSFKIIKNEQLKNSFSFFNIIFINPKDLTDNEIQSIVAHENIHVSQYHTLDIILVELLSAVMWFNPFVWLLRKSLRQVHEYLADEGVLNIGFDRLEYQALLINQVAESRLVSLATSFNQSQIKNRIFMMTKLNSVNKTKLKILALVPITALLLISIACVNGQNKTNVVTAVEPVKMNVLYLGVDNPVRIAASGFETSDLSVSIDNGTITGSNGEYVIQPKQAGSAVVTISSKGKEIQKTQFRVKIVPDPVAKIAGIKGSGAIEKAYFLKQTEINAAMENFDFDLNFEITQFTITTVEDGKNIESTSFSNKITSEQLKLIEKCKPDQRIYIENIKAKGPDGTTRQLSAIMIKVK
jgi:beta-lactamase regulating signal transducer with metallopeptidase domain